MAPTRVRAVLARAGTAMSESMQARKLQRARALSCAHAHMLSLSEGALVNLTALRVLRESQLGISTFCGRASSC
jgi:hypothetical protein